MSVIVPTDEQGNVCAQSKIHRLLKISAYAGAAKTSTLVMVAEEHVVPSLMLTFNKSLADEARGRFPSWVECRTTHSLAYASFGAQLQKKLKRPQGAYKNVAGTGTEIAKYFKTGDFIYMIEGEREARKMKAGGVGVAIKETVAKYEQSADEELGYKHVSINPCDQILLKDEKSMRAFKYLVLSCAQKLWRLRTDLRSDVLATHDTYLKLFQLSKPDLSRYEVLYLDECQDVNEVVLDIFLRQKDKCRLYAVGDGFQNIYSWRGAKNAMLELDWPEASLSKSFRFGQAIGDLADCVLARDGRKITAVKGWEKLTTKIMPKYEIPQEIWDGPYTMLFRTNGALIFEAVDLMEQGKRVNLEIDVTDFTKLLDSAIELHRGNLPKVKHESLVQFASWKECETEAEAVQGELLRVFNMVQNGSVYKILGVLSKHKNCQDPDVTLTTAHKSKGREFDVVILADDFPSPYNQQGEWVGLQDMERNLLYVALTRTKKVLGYNQTVIHMIERCSPMTQYEHEITSELDVDELFDQVVGKQVRQMDRELQDILV
jgi:superfamily I DNA/RNA helicase